MDVSLYVYDLTKGMARQMSRAFLGIQIDAVYHTGVVLNGIEYFFGSGIHTSSPPGATHHGQPMEIIPLGQTSLPPDVILDYLDSLKEIYTPESYDLFAHNCNNFSHDFATFLVGKGIPSHITALPKRVLDTPFGQMLKPQLESVMKPITQAPLESREAVGANLRHENCKSVAPTSKHGATKPNQHSNARSDYVHVASNATELRMYLDQAKPACAVIFFTSSTCPPCKFVYPLFEELAVGAGTKAVMIKVDVGVARDVAADYSIRATPTFMSFLKGKYVETWQGANTTTLKWNVEALVQSAFPPHPHRKLKIPKLMKENLSPVTYQRVPPLEKIVDKLGSRGDDPIVTSIIDFIKTRTTEGANEAPLPNLSEISIFFVRWLNQLPEYLLFAAYDLFRLLLVDSRVSGYYLSASPDTVVSLLENVDTKDDPDATALYNLRLITVHLACNLFTSNLTTMMLDHQRLTSELVNLVSECILDSLHGSLRVAAASLAFNIAAMEHRQRMEKDSDYVGLSEELQTQLTALLVRFISEETTAVEAVRSSVVSLGRMLYLAPTNGELMDLCKAMDAADELEHLTEREAWMKPLTDEVAQLLP